MNLERSVYQAGARLRGTPKDVEAATVLGQWYAEHCVWGASTSLPIGGMSELETRCLLCCKRSFFGRRGSGR